MRRVQLAEYLYLLLDVFNLVLGRLKVDDLDGDNLLGDFLVTEVGVNKWTDASAG